MESAWVVALCYYTWVLFLCIYLHFTILTLLTLNSCTLIWLHFRGKIFWAVPHSSLVPTQVFKKKSKNNAIHSVSARLLSSLRWCIKWKILPRNSPDPDLLVISAACRGCMTLAERIASEHSSRWGGVRCFVDSILSIASRFLPVALSLGLASGDDAVAAELSGGSSFYMSECC